MSFRNGRIEFFKGLFFFLGSGDDYLRVIWIEVLDKIEYDLKEKGEETVISEKL